MDSAIPFEDGAGCGASPSLRTFAFAFSSVSNALSKLNIFVGNVGCATPFASMTGEEVNTTANQWGC